MGKREVERFTHCGKRWNWGCDYSKEQANMRSLICHLKPCWYSGTMLSLRIILIWVVCAAIRGHENVQTQLPESAVSRPMGLPQSAAALMLMSCVTNRGRVDVSGLGCHLNICWYASTEHWSKQPPPPLSGHRWAGPAFYQLPHSLRELAPSWLGNKGELTPLLSREALERGCGWQIASLQHVSVEEISSSPFQHPHAEGQTPHVDEEGELAPQADRSTQLPMRHWSSTWRWPTSTSTPPMSCLSSWRGQSCKIKAAECQWHRARTGYLKEESWWGPSIDSVAEANGLIHSNDTMQWAFASQTVWAKGILCDTLWHSSASVVSNFFVCCLFFGAERSWMGKGLIWRDGGTGRWVDWGTWCEVHKEPIKLKKKEGKKRNM